MASKKDLWPGNFTIHSPLIGFFWTLDVTENTPDATTTIWPYAI